MTISDVVVAVLVLTAATLTLLAAIGLQRFGSVFARLHAATKAITLGVVLVAIGAAINVDSVGDTVKLLLTALLQLVTAPIASNMIARAAYRSGTETSDHMVVDELGPSEAGRRGLRVRVQPPRNPGLPRTPRDGAGPSSAPDG